MKYKRYLSQKKTPKHNCMQLNNWIIRKFFKYSKEYYITPNSSPSPYLYSYMKLKTHFEQLHYARLKHKKVTS